MGLEFNRLVQAIGVGGGAAIAINNARFALAGDSLIGFEFPRILVDGSATLVRDAAGVVTCTLNGHGQIFKQPMAFCNMVDPTFNEQVTVSVGGINTLTWQSAVVGSAASTTGQVTIGCALLLRAPSGQGVFNQMNTMLGGGLKLTANYAMPGVKLTDASFAPLIARTAASNAQWVLLNGGINDRIAGSASAPVISGMTTHINTLVGAGKKVLLVNVTPLANGTGKTVTDEINVGYAAIASANPGKVFLVDACAAIETTPGSTQAKTTMVNTDLLHWSPLGAKTIAAVAVAAAGANLTSTSFLPTSSSDTPSVTMANGEVFTCVKQLGSWTGTGGGANNFGSGTIAAGNNCQGFDSLNTTVGSMIDRGAGLGWWQQLVTQNGAANVTNYYFGATPTALSALNIAVADKIFVVLEMEADNASTGNVTQLQFQIDGQTGNSFRTIFGASADGTVYAPASIGPAWRNQVIVGPVEVPAGITSMFLMASISTQAAGGTALTTRFGRCAIYKKTA